jgi:hypothetical protein
MRRRLNSTALTRADGHKAQLPYRILSVNRHGEVSMVRVWLSRKNISRSNPTGPHLSPDTHGIFCLLPDV